MVSLSARDCTADTSLILGQANGPFKVSYNARDLLLYALGIGCSTKRNGNATNGSSADELRFLHEKHAAGFRAFPTYPLVLPYKGTSSDVVNFPGPTLHLVPHGLQGLVEPMSILHYDQSLDIVRPLDPKGATLETRSEVVGLYQRRGGILVRTASTLTDGKGKILSVSTKGTFIRGLKITGDAGPALPSHVPRPSGPPDAVSRVTVSSEQALLYRLSGDYNPLHADPEAARAAGLTGTILHGLCTLGIAARQILLQYCSGEPSALNHVSCRFSRTVRPGELLEVNMWRSERADLGKIIKDSGQSIDKASITADPLERCTGLGAWPQRHGIYLREFGLVGKSGKVTEQVIRFEVCAPEQAGAVVVADGKAVLLLEEGSLRLLVGEKYSEIDSERRPRL